MPGSRGAFNCVAAWGGLLEVVPPLFLDSSARPIQPDCLAKLNGTLICDPFAPGASNLARRATALMQLATPGERPVLLETFTESTSPLGATLMRMTSLPAWVGSFSSPFW